MALIRFASSNLLSRPVRSLLALLGLTVAIMGMVGLFSVAAGLDATVDQTFGRIEGLVAMQPGAPIPLFSRIPAAWADEVERLPGVRVVCREVWARAQLVEGKATFSPPRFLFGADSAAVRRLRRAVYRDDIVAGRYLVPEDRGTLNCVISRQIAAEHHKHVGDALRVDGRQLPIVGIYDGGSLFLDVAIILDIDSVRSLSRTERDILSGMYVEPDGTVPTPQLLVEVRDHFRGRISAGARPLSVFDLNGGQTGNVLVDFLTAVARALQPPPPPSSDAADAGAEDALEVRSATEWGERFQEFSSDLDLFLWLMNGIGVAIALLSILNTMLMSVSERMIEFGVLKANGWSAGDVLRLIIAESAILGLCGGVCGCLLGWGATHVLNWWFPTKLHLYAAPQLLLMSLAFSTGLGVLGGLYPAWWAVRMTPMEAIRRG